MRRKYFRTHLFLTVLVLSNSILIRLSAQEVKLKLLLDSAIVATLNNNKAVQFSKLDESIAAAKYKQTEAIYLPQIGFSYTAMSTNNPLNAFGFKLQQKSISGSDFNPDLLNHPSATPDFITKLEVLQPLINMDAVYMRKGAAIQMDIDRFKTQRTKEYLTFEVKKAYLQLQLAYNTLAVLEDALTTTKAVYVFTDNHFKQGLIQKSDLLNVQVQVATIESNIVKAKTNIHNASDYLSVLMGLPIGTVYTTQEATTINTISSDSVTNIRADFMATKKAIDASNLMIQSSKMSYLPKLNAFGSYQLNDSRMLGFGAGAYLAGIQLSWDIFKGNSTKNSIATQTLERNKLSVQLSQQQEQSQLELNTTKRAIGDAQAEMAKQTIVVQQAAEAIRILQNRYEQGLVTTTDVMMATTQLAQQKLTLVQAQFSQNVSNAYLQFLTTSTTK